MHKPDHDSAVAVRPATAAAGTPGWFQNGDPAEGIRGTVLDADFLNDLVANLLAVLTAGGVTPVKGEDNNLRDAILAMIAGGTVPVGAIVSFAATAAPTGYVKANGVLLSRATYASLWAHAQASGAIVSDATWLAGRPGAWSTGDGSTTFRIPDFRGLFMRGFHDGSGTYETDTARTLGSYQADELKSHNHFLKTRQQSGTVNPEIPSDSQGTYDEAAITTMNTGGTETRPKNTASLICIKY